MIWNQRREWNQSRSPLDLSPKILLYYNRIRMKQLMKRRTKKLYWRALENVHMMFLKSQNQKRQKCIRGGPSTRREISWGCTALHWGCAPSPAHISWCFTDAQGRDGPFKVSGMETMAADVLAFCWFSVNFSHTRIETRMSPNCQGWGAHASSFLPKVYGFGKMVKSTRIAAFTYFTQKWPINYFVSLFSWPMWKKYWLMCVRKHNIAIKRAISSTLKQPLCPFKTHHNL